MLLLLVACLDFGLASHKSIFFRGATTDNRSALVRGFDADSVCLESAEASRGFAARNAGLLVVLAALSIVFWTACILLVVQTGGDDGS